MHLLQLVFAIQLDQKYVIINQEAVFVDQTLLGKLVTDAV